jgi:hypothetical protein
LALLQTGVSTAGPPLDVFMTATGHAHIDVAWLWTLAHTGDSIVFVARFEGNTIVFPSEGYSVASPEFQQHLQAVEFNVPRPRAADSLH